MAEMVDVPKDREERLAFWRSSPWVKDSATKEDIARLEAKVDGLTQWLMDFREAWIRDVSVSRRELQDDFKSLVKTLIRSR